MRSSKLRSKANDEPGGSSYTSAMLIVRFSTAALPAIERLVIGTTNSRESKCTESFCVSLKRSTRDGSLPSTT